MPKVRVAETDVENLLEDRNKKFSVYAGTGIKPRTVVCLSKHATPYPPPLPSEQDKVRNVKKQKKI